jgi:hypothetical protein
MAKRFSIRFIQKTLLLPLFLLGLAGLTTLTTFLGQNPKAQTEALVENSIYNHGPSGYKAWFLTAQKIGLPLRVWESSFNELNTLPTPATMLIVKPFTVSGSSVVFGKKEAALLMQWVAKGNTLILLDDFNRFGSNALAQQLQLTVHQSALLKEKTRAGKHNVSQNISPNISLLTRLNIVDTDKHLRTYVKAPIISQTHISLLSSPASQNVVEPILTDTQGNTRLARIPYQGGRLILGTMADLAENQYLNQPANDNYQLLANLLKRQNSAIYVNEFVHGYLANDDLMSYFQKKTPLGSIFAQLVLFFCLLLWISFVRWAPKPQEPEKQTQNLDTGGQNAYIQSLAGLYLKSKSPSLALGPQLKQLETTLRQRYRLEMEEEARLQDLLTTLFADYSSIEEYPAQLLDAFKRAKLAILEEQTPISQQDLLKLSRQLTLIEERLRHGNRTFCDKR